MLALYRGGRQAEALEVYQEFRRALSEQLGLEPGPGLQQLETAILARDPSLELPPPNGARARATAVMPDALPAAVTRHRLRLAGGAAALLVVAAVGAALALSSGGSGPPAVIAADSVGAISLHGGAIGADVPIGSSPSALTAGAGALWASNYNAGTVSRIDPRTDALVQTITAGQTPSGIAVGGGSVWVANYIVGTVSRINPTVNRVVQTLTVGNAPSGVAYGDGSVWVTNTSDGTLTRIDAVTGTVRDTFAVGGEPTGVAYGLGFVWVSDASDGRVLELDPATGQLIQAIDVGTGPGPVTVADDAVWVANTLDGTVSRIDPVTSAVTATIAVGDTPDAVAAGDGGVWVADQFGDRVVWIDPRTDSVEHAIAVGNPPTALAFANGLVWAGVQPSTASNRGGTLVLLQSVPVGPIDPAATGSVAAVLTVVMTNDGLTAFKRVGGSDGAEVVPDLAVSLPSPTDGGRTYTFALRRGIRYSNGETVGPEDFLRAAQRDFVLGDTFPFGNVVGEATCAAHPSHCDLSRGIVPDSATDSITFHLAAPDPDFLSKLALWEAAAIAPGTPFHDVGSHAVAATGPYEVTSDTSRELVLGRNPYFREWSHSAQPDGYPDRIIWRTGASVPAEVSEVAHGQADYTLDPPPPGELSAIATRLPSQLHVTLDDVTIQLALNSREAPFDNVLVRRALNYAVNREKLAELLGQDSQPTCQALPPEVLGYKKYCPYTLDPNPAGSWNGPDLAAARHLIAESGTRGAAITIWSAPAYMTPSFTTAARYLAGLLRQLGYPTRVRVFNGLVNMFDHVFAPNSKWQAYDLSVVPNFPAPSQFLGPDIDGFGPDIAAGCPQNFYNFCDPRFDATVRAATTAQAAGSPTAEAIWANADKQFTDQAAAVDLVTPSITDFVSHRVGNYEYNPQLGVLPDQLWVH
jgi:YVTN family beta-propeller protein